MRKQAERKIAAQTKENHKTDKWVEKGEKVAQNELYSPETAFESKGTGAKNKYNNQRCEFSGIKFDSKKELRRYLQLKGMQESGLISELKLQHHFTLVEAFKTTSGESVRRMEYIADFTYKDADGVFVIEDVKSEATRKDKVYCLKKKLMAQSGYLITEV